MVPEGWKASNLGECINLLTDYTANGSFASLKDNIQYYGEPNYAVLVRTTDLEKKEFIPQRFTDKKGYDFLKKSALYPNDIVIANVGSTGKVYKIPQYHLPMTLAPNMYLVRFSKEIDSNYAFYILSSDSFQRELIAQSSTTSLKSINKKNFRNISFLKPPLSEQKQIAEVLGGVDAAIEASKAVIEQTKKVKQGLLQTLLTRGIGHTKFKSSPLGEIPVGWEVKLLRELALNKKGLQTGPFGSQLHASDYSQHGTPVIMPKNIANEKVVLDTIARVPDTIKSTLARHGVLEGDILFGRRGDIGRCCLISKNEEGYLCGTGCLRVRINQDHILPRYLIKYLKTAPSQDWLVENAVGQTMLNLNTAILGNLPIALPPLPEQAAIAAILESIDTQLTTETTKLTTLQTLKKGLMHDLLTGKVRVREMKEKAA